MHLEDHLDKLKAFKIIVDCGTMREAAVKLNVTQPSLTRLIQTLETSAQVTLLQRGRSGVTATEAGRILLAYADTTLKNLKDLEERLKHPTDDLSGHLLVGSYESLTEYLWPDFIATFRKTTPQLRLSIRTSDSAGHSQALEHGKIDILVDAEPRVVGDFMSWVLYEDRFNFYVHDRNKAALTAQTIGSLPLIFCPSAYDQDNKKIVQHLEEAGYFFKERIELDSFPSVMAFCQRGIGLAILPSRLAKAAVHAKKIFPVELKGFSRHGFGAHSIAASIQSSRKEDPRIRLLIRSLKDWFKG